MAQKKSSERLVRDIKRNTRRKFSSEEKIRIVIDGLRGETSIAELCRRDSFYLDRPFVLTKGKNLVTGMPYMFSEGNHTKAVRLVDIQVVDGILNLKAEELQTLKTFTLSWNLDYQGSYYLWTIADLPTLMKTDKK